MIAALVAAIPSPSSGSVHIGPLKLNAYGFLIAIGVIVAVRITTRRAVARGVTTADDIASVAMWGVPAGIVGGRLYHVVTSLDSFRGRWIEVLYVWHGGLGIWGGIALGAAAGMLRAWMLARDPFAVVACATPAIAVAQAIGRWGNWFNQELFGKPTTLPWALEVSAEKARAAGYAAGTTFHPTFLYESIGCLIIAWLVVRIERKYAPPGARIFLTYVGLYSFMRFFIEGLRVDPAHHVGGLRLNQWVAVVVYVAAVGTNLVRTWRSPGRPGGSTVNNHE